jgi:hypothetical protein
MTKIKPNSKRGIARIFLTKNPNASFDDFVKKTGNRKKITKKDFTNAQQYLRNNSKKPSDDIYSGLTEKRKNIAKYIVNNPDNTYSLFLKDNPRSKIEPTTFSHMRSKILKKMNLDNGQIKKFKKTMVTILGNPSIPVIKSNSDYDKFMEWINKDILNVINSSQSNFKYSIVRYAMPENQLELRMQSAR